MFVPHFFKIFLFFIYCNASSKNLLSLFLQNIQRPVLFSSKLITFNSNWLINSPRETAVDIVLHISEDPHGHWTQKRFLEVNYKSSCSALINAVMKYLNFHSSGSELKSRFYSGLLKIALHHKIFSENFTISAKQWYWKVHPDGCFWWQLIPEIFLNDSFSETAVEIYFSILEFLNSHILHFFLWRHVKEEQILLILRYVKVSVKSVST